ncbi:hypothetical protein Tco_0707534 [Tanacetum coccineum]|uniref:Uncharacterized protein n=1 Tax=Tanacetum coccineum TaxID=301880 RepID=A0ABQ4YBZ8_9ASTR
MGAKMVEMGRFSYGCKGLAAFGFEREDGVRVMCGSYGVSCGGLKARLKVWRLLYGVAAVVAKRREMWTEFVFLGSLWIHIEQRIAAMMGYRGGRIEGDEEKLDDVLLELESSFVMLDGPCDAAA